MKIYAFGDEKVVVLVLADIRTNPSCQKLCYWYKNINEGKKKNMIRNCGGLFCVWCIGLPPAVMGWAASYGDGPKYF